MKCASYKRICKATISACTTNVRLLAVANCLSRAEDFEIVESDTPPTRNLRISGNEKVVHEDGWPMGRILAWTLRAAGEYKDSQKGLNVV